MARHPLTEIFRSARERCTNPKNPGYRFYGARGIRFLFESVDEMERCLGPRPGAKYSIDRIDNDGNYQVGNVRWATHAEQTRNTRGWVKAERQRARIGELLTGGNSITDVARIVGISRQRVHQICKSKGVLGVVPSTNRTEYHPLTDRECEVVRLLTSGKSVAETAETLGISFKTAETHRSNLMRKIDAHNAVEMTLWAVRQDLVPRHLVERVSA